MGIRIEASWLDYAEVSRQPKLMENLSAIVWAEPFLWTASDEGRTVECLSPAADGFRLHSQIQLDDIFTDLPGSRNGDEVDIESIDVVDDQLWICGSHCNVRRQSKRARNHDRIDPRLRARKSRQLLGNVSVTALLGDRPRGRTVPFSGRGSLRCLLSKDPYLSPFVQLPSKENGLDIEGFCLSRGRALIGLRGPIVDSIGVVVELKFKARTNIHLQSYRLHFLNMEGLGVRDLARWDDSILVLAGPVSAARSPFRLYRWQVRNTASVQQPALLYEWGSSAGAPEGICRYNDSLLVVHDMGNDRTRVRGTRFRADRLIGIE